MSNCNLAVILHENVVGYSSIIKNERTSETVLLTSAEELGELAQEISIHRGHAYKDQGIDGVMGEAIDVIAAASDLSYLLDCNDDVKDTLEKMYYSFQDSNKESILNNYFHLMVLQGYVMESWMSNCPSQKDKIVAKISEMIFRASLIIENVCSDQNESVTMMISKLEKWKRYYSLPEGYSIGTWEDDTKKGYIFYTDEHGVPPVEVYETKKEAMKAAWQEYSYPEK